MLVSALPWPAVPTEEDRVHRHPPHRRCLRGGNALNKRLARAPFRTLALTAGLTAGGAERMAMIRQPRQTEHVIPVLRCRLRQQVFQRHPDRRNQHGSTGHLVDHPRWSLIA